MLLNITLLQGFLFRGTEGGGVQKRDGTEGWMGTDSGMVPKEGGYKRVVYRNHRNWKANRNHEIVTVDPSGNSFSTFMN